MLWWSHAIRIGRHYRFGHGCPGDHAITEVIRVRRTQVGVEILRGGCAGDRTQFCMDVTRVLGMDALVSARI